jgi:hypothetical protein
MVQSHVPGNKFRLYKGGTTFLSRGSDSSVMESDHKVSLHEPAVQFDKFLAGSFIPVLGFTPQIPELLQNALRLMEEKILFNGTPRAVQSASNPTIDEVWIRSIPR